MIGVWKYVGYAKDMMVALKELLATHGITMEYTLPSGTPFNTTISFAWEGGGSSSSDSAYLAAYAGSNVDTVFTCVFNTDANNPFVTITSNANGGEISNTSNKLACLLCGKDVNDNIIGSWLDCRSINLNVLCNIPQMVLASGVTGGLLVTNLISGWSTNLAPKVAKNIYVISNGYKLTPNQVLVDSTGTKKMLSVGGIFLVDYNDEEIVVL